MIQKTTLLFVFLLNITTIYSTYAQDNESIHNHETAIHDLKQLMPIKATVDGRRIYDVESDNICYVTLTTEYYKKYRFSFLAWPNQTQTDASGYIGYFLKDSDDKPHIIRTDAIKGEKIISIINDRIQSCQKAETSN